MKVPEAQCPGNHTFNYAVFAHAGDWKKAKVWRQAHQHNVPLRYAVTSVHPGRLPREHSFIEVGPDNLVVSALKKSDRDDSLILRVYNTTGEEVTASVRPGFSIGRAEFANMNEEPTGEQITPSEDGSLSFSMPGFRVQTLRMSLNA
jgi:alpha-mannosidase